MARIPPRDRPGTGPGTGTARRDFLRTLGNATLGLAALGLAPAGRVLAGPVPGAGRRQLAFVHTHTGETLATAYYDDGRYLDAELAKVNVLLRDFRSEAVHPIDPQVLDRLFLLQSASGSAEPFQVISGYRSPASNEALRNRSSGVAEHSLHIEGRAIDVRLAGVPTARLALLAQRQAAGGVGYYRVSDFVHVDTGRVRTWGDALPAGAASGIAPAYPTTADPAQGQPG
jgi:uncharacterized protein YcbK (DUF882 family)